MEFIESGCDNVSSITLNSEQSYIIQCTVTGTPPLTVLLYHNSVPIGNVIQQSVSSIN